VTTVSDFLNRMRQHRELIEEFGRIIDDECGGEGGFQPSQDLAFWRDFERIEDAGRKLDTAQSGWLANLTQGDDLGPNGRSMFLASAALAALALMPSAALSRGRELFAGLTAADSQYRKVGVAKVLVASGREEVLPLLEILAGDEHSYVQREVGWALQELRLRLGEAEPAP
jgi:hypothetical protein